MKTLDLHTIQTFYKKRAANSHKGTHGHALIVAGSKLKMGAAIITTKACLRSGVGLVTLLVSKKEKKVVFTSVPEAMIEIRSEKIDLTKYNAIAVGPGIGTDSKTEKLLEKLLENSKIAVILDADALNILSTNQTWLYKIPKGTILTPHIKEFDRLFGNHQTTEERKNKTIEKAKELGCIIVLKGQNTFVTNGSQNYENTTGNSGLAKGGSGDALTGIITAFLAQGYEPLNAALLGVYLHGLAADITLETQSEESMLITDVIENLGNAFKIIRK